MPGIDVPYVSQGDDDTGCVWACIKMIVEFYHRKYPDLPNPDVEIIKRAIGYEKEGTPLEGVIGINQYLRGEQHELVFEWEDYAEFSDIEAELTNTNPVIVWIKQNRASPLHHVIVVKGATTVDLRVYVNDPDPDEPGEQTVEDFMNAWRTGDRILIRAHVRLRASQRRLEDS